VVLYRSSERVHLPPKAVDLLYRLLRAPGEVLTRETLQAELWPDVVVEEGNLSKQVFFLRQALAADPEWAEAIETVPKRGYRFVGRVERLPALPAAVVPVTAALDVPAPRTCSGRTLAVLPFAESDPADQYLAEGLASRILEALVKVPGLAVLARTSAFREGSARDDPLAAGARLGVDLLVSGRLSRTATGFRVTARLDALASGRMPWSLDVERRAADLFLLDASIASAIAAALELSAPGPIRPARHVPQKAFEKVMQARYLWNRRPGEVVNQAIRCYEEALAIDPENAEAWSGLAEVYASLGSWEAGVLPHAEGQSKAMAHAARALAIDPTLAVAHAALGYASLHFGWDPASAEQSFRSALTLDGHCVDACHWYSHLLTACGRVEESLEQSKRCLQLDPMNLLMTVHLAWHHHMAREPSQVVEVSERVVAMDPRYHWGHYFLAWGLESLGEHARALASAREATRVSSGNPVMTSLLGRALALDGEHSAARETAAQVIQAGGPEEKFAYELGLIHLALAEVDQALGWLERARSRRSGWMAYLDVDPRLDVLRTEPRFQALSPGIARNAARGREGRPD
jgi:DNA-binding winged helix-turn-helix (wHTH) protein/Flp pilus assembly protein TadD